LNLQETNPKPKSKMPTTVRFVTPFDTTSRMDFLRDIFKKTQDFLTKAQVAKKVAPFHLDEKDDEVMSEIILNFGYDTVVDIAKLWDSSAVVGSIVETLYNEQPERAPLHITIETDQKHDERTKEIKNISETNRNKFELGVKAVKATILATTAKDSKTAYENEYGQHVMWRGKDGKPWGAVRDLSITGGKTGLLLGPLTESDDESIPIGPDGKGKSKIFSIVAVINNTGVFRQQVFPRHEGSYHKQFSYISLATPKDKNFGKFLDMVGKEFIVQISKEYTSDPKPIQS